MEQTFGSFLREKRMARGLTLRGMAAKLDLSPVYMSNIENDRRAAPSQEYLERMALLLQLDKPEREWMLDLAAKSKQNRVSADLPDYIMDREIVRAALRTAREADATDQEWQDFIDRINQRMRSYEHPKQPAYAPSAEVIRLSNAINRSLEQPDSPEAVMALILQGAAARYDCCPEPISEYENFDHLPKADWNHFRRVVSYITITQEHIITVQFTDQAGKDE